MAVIGSQDTDLDDDAVGEQGQVSTSTIGRIRDAWAARRAGSEWLLQTTQRELRRRLAGDRPWNFRAWATLQAYAREPGQSGSWRVIVTIAAYFSGLLLIALALRVIDPTFLPEWRPRSDSDDLRTAWQVQAALVGAALPFLFVLLPLVKNEALAPTRTAQVLLADTLIFPILTFGLAGVIWIGVTTTWLSTDGGVWLTYFFVLVPTTLGVGWAYFSASRIISDAQRLRTQSERLVVALIDDALVDQQGQAYANGELVDLLEEHGIRKSGPLLEADDAIPVLAVREGRLTDVNRAALRAWLQELDVILHKAPSASFQTGVDGPAASIATAAEVRGWWRPLIGDGIQAGQPVVVLLALAGHEVVDPTELAITLDRCLRVA